MRPHLFAIFAAGVMISAAASAQSDNAGAPIVMAQASDDPFSALVGKKRTRRAERARRVKIERYVLASDDRAFLFEDRSNEARVKFLCGNGDTRLDCTLDPNLPAAEVYHLTATRGPRGDVIYKDLNGETLLRIASYGGATVFWPGEGRGLAASKSFGDDPALKLDPVDRSTAHRRAQSATAIVSAAVGAPIVFDIGRNADAPVASVEMALADVAVDRTDNQDAAVLADAVVRTAKAIKQVARDPTGARIIANRIRYVSFMRDSAPSITLTGNRLEIHYVPDQDILGRPSSGTVVQFLEESL